MNSSLISIDVITVDDADYRQVWLLREEVLRKPLGLSLVNEDLSGDRHDTILAARNGSDIVGCVMLRHTDEQTVRLRAMAVYTEWQGKGVGSMLVTHAETIAAQKYRHIILHARKVAMEFYRKLGYHTIGNEFYEVGIPHYLMGKQIA
jgi:ribosomal protein S18 acetylase RimI-like enzyme